MENTMNMAAIKEHWEKLAKNYAEDLKSTTKTPTIKMLEINALYNAIKSSTGLLPGTRVLEVGCGNGHNLFGLSKLCPALDFTGVDYSPTMIANAQKINEGDKTSHVKFFVGDILELERHKDLADQYDVVFTDRCIINLNTVELQHRAISQLEKKVKAGGHLIMIENSVQSYGNQNSCRESIGLTRRTPDQYNLFMDETLFLEFTKTKLQLDLKEIVDFGSLHDLLLYVLIPKTNGGKVDYAHPLMDAVTELSLSTSTDFKNAHGSFGQNRLYLFKKGHDQR